MTSSAWNVRLKRERERLWPKAQGEAADAFGVTRESMSRYETGAAKPGLASLLKMAENGVDVLYVLTGRHEAKAAALAGYSAPHMGERPAKWQTPQRENSTAPVRPDTQQAGAPPMGGFSVTPTGGLLVRADRSSAQPLRLSVAFDGGQKLREFQVIPRYRATASAGPTDGRQVEADDLAVDSAGVMAMDRAFMREQLGGDGAGFVSVLVKGDSMERTLIDGETIIIDSAVNEVDGSGIYVVRVGKNLLVKRLVLRIDGGVLVKSDNPAYAVGDQEFNADQAQSIKVVGRMVWPKFR